MPVIDIHAHIVDRDYLAELKALYGLVERVEAPKTFLQAGHDTMAWWRDDMFDVAGRVAHMRGQGIDRRVISLSTPNVYCWRGAKQVEMARFVNDRLAALCAQSGGAFVGLGSLPLEDLPASLSELDRVLGTLGLAGVAIGTNVNGRDLDHADFEPLWKVLAARKVPVFVHPMFPERSPRLADYELPLRLGLPFDTTLFATRLLYGGVLERHPDLRLVLSHTGGALITLLERLDNGWRIFPECRKFTSQLPSVYAKRLFFDTASFSPPLLRMAADAVGISQLLFGSDDPFIGATTQHVLDAKFAPADERAVLGGNVERLLAAT